MSDSRAMHQLSELTEELQGCDHRRQLAGVCGRYARHLGFEWFLLGVYLPGPDEIVTLSGYPEEWLARYTENGYVHDDPVVRHCLTHSAVLDWSTLGRGRGRRGASGRRIMNEAAASGLRQGLSTPIHGPGAEGGMLSVASSASAVDLRPGTETMLQFAAQSMHQSLRRIVLRESDARGAAPSAATLTEREAECLRWTASGKTSWEISRILDISENTVTFHLRNAIAKMHVSNRPQAVAKAVAQSLITLI